MKIMVYSPDDSIRATIISVLSDHYDMVLTDTVEQCLEVIKNTDIGTLLFDVDNQENPVEEIKAIHTDNPDIKIISLGRSEATQDAIEVGANGYILKPIKSDELLSNCK